MIFFWISACLLLALALALTLPALLKPKINTHNESQDASQANLSVLRGQLAQLDSDFAAGKISTDQLTLAKNEIERRALEEEGAPENAMSGNTQTPSKRTAWTLAILVPLIALLIYGFLGNVEALDPANLQARPSTEPTPEQIEAMVSAFAARLQAIPADQTPDPKAWEMLARSYAAMQKFPEASKAYKRAVELNPGNSQILADYADVLAMLQGQSMAGEPTQLFERALVLEPNNPKALALAGSAAFEKKDFAKAIVMWNKAQSSAPPGSDFAKSLASSIEEAKAAAGTNNITPSNATAVGGVAASIQGTLSLSPDLKIKVAPEDTVFIFARAEPTSPNAPRMPLAILKRKASEFPMAFTLDDSTAMSNELKISKFEAVVVSARISKSGNAFPQSGDLIAQSIRVKVGASQLTLTVDAVQP